MGDKILEQKSGEEGSGQELAMGTLFWMKVTRQRPQL